MTVRDETDSVRSASDAVRSTAGDVERPGADDSERTGTRGGRSGVTVYRWACPVCGASGTGIASGTETPYEKATFSLRQHVRTSDDGAHGPANTFPPGFDPDDVGKAVSID